MKQRSGRSPIVCKREEKIMAAIPAGYQKLDKSHREVRTGAKRIGPADVNEVISVTVRLRRQPGAPALPSPQATANGAPRPKVVAREDFARIYGASPADIAQVESFAKTAGLTVVDTNAERRTVVLSGTVGQMSRAFGVELNRYQTAEETYRGREGELFLPAGLLGIVEGVFGLDNRRMARRASAMAPALFTGTAVPLTPLQVADLYQFPTPLNAAGQTVGLLEFGGGFTQSDINTFFSGLQLPAPTPVAVGVNGATNSPGNRQHPNGDDVEVALDIDVAASVAQGVQIAVYFSTFDENGWVQAVTTAVRPNPKQPAPSVISISWGWPELESIGTFAWSPAAISAVSETFEEAAALGITVFAASGDGGSSCGFTDGKAHVLYPGSDPWLTSCGGSILTNVEGSSFTEETWQDGNGEATGGGVSSIFVPPPQWQSTVNLPPSVNDGHKGRTIPDVAGNADPASGYDLILYGSGIGAVGGTSAVAPLYAGLVAVLNAKLGIPVGFLNPTLYSNPNMYNGIADGVSNSTNGAPGYTSVAGYDACTGWGSIIGTKLMAQLSGLTRSTHRVAIAASPGGALQVVYLWADDLPYLVWQDTTGGWHPFGALPNPKNTPYSAVAMGVGNGGNLQAVYIGKDDGQPYLIWQNAQGTWSNFGALPNPNKTPYSAVAIGVGNAGNLQAVCIGRNDGQPYLIWQNAQGTWSNFGVLPNLNKTPYSAVAMGVGNGGNLQAVCIGRNDGQPYLIWQNAQGTWNNFGALPNPNKTPYTEVATGVGNGGNLQVVCIGELDDQPYLIWQSSTTGTWSYFGALPNPNDTPYAAVATGVGNAATLQILCIGKNDGLPYLIWQNQQGAWSNFGVLPDPNKTPFYAAATGIGNGGNLQAVCLCKDDPTNTQPTGLPDPSGQPYLIWQSSITGTWSSFGFLTTASITAASAARKAGNHKTRKAAG
jgi:kumamolisin